MGKIVFVVNPNAANGTAAAQWPQIADMAQKRLGTFETLFTERVGHAMELARGAAAGGADLIVSVGGDGTMNEVANGLMNEDGTPVNPQIAVGQISIGTGGDFRKTTGLPKDIDAAFDWLVGDAVRPIDVGRMEMTGHDGEPQVRYFVNIASAGIGGAVDERVNMATKILGGFFSFFWGTITAMLSFKNVPMRIVLDDERDLGERRVFSLAVANGRFFGGGMQMAPGADMSDGLFDVVIIGDVDWSEKLSQLPRIYSGAHLGHEKVEIHRAKKVEAISDHTALLDVDGEVPGRLPTTFTICPGALKFKVKQ
ncbi:MAG: diacylglycerol kinase family lipid kinase [Candidatus Lernaella stagnicola]|nr:diacylglycerol kinase family lipid kinase [Candidatus Lernaella stagnicola]